MRYHSCNYLQITCSTAPDSPANVTATTTSATSIMVAWGMVPLMEQNGAIIRYEVMYTPLETFEETLGSHLTNVSGSDSVDLTGLEEYVNYNISLRAYTSVGAGPYSVGVTVLTMEGGTSCKYIFIAILSILYNSGWSQCNSGWSQCRSRTIISISYSSMCSSVTSLGSFVACLRQRQIISSV